MILSHSGKSNGIIYLLTRQRGRISFSSTLPSLNFISRIIHEWWPTPAPGGPEASQVGRLFQDLKDPEPDGVEGEHKGSSDERVPLRAI
jgi:hypothetical protein